jgi:2-hydroxy-3-oxopropionate reductase
MSEQIGFIGLGLMGKPMVRNLLKRGYAVNIFNRSQVAIDELASDGAIPASSPREVASRSSVVITMLPDAPEVEQVLLGPDGVFAGSQPGALVIDMSTISPRAAVTLAASAQEHGLGMLDAPVSGGDVGAINATLSIMVGGALSDFERARPIFEALGKTITYCGESGKGQIVKACNQLMVGILIEAVSEALVFGSKLGVDPEIILKVLGGGLAQNRVMELRGPTMIKHKFEPGGKAKFHYKDLRIILEMARESNIALPATTVVDMLFASLLANGGGDLDHSALITVIEKLSNFSL